MESHASSSPDGKSTDDIRPYPVEPNDWLWFRPQEEPAVEHFLEAAEGWYAKVYYHKPCEVRWTMKVSEAWQGQPRCFNCGKWVRRY